MKKDNKIIGEKVYDFVFRYYKIILISLTVIVLSIPLIKNYLNYNVLIMGGESYYHLLNKPVNLITNFLPDSIIYFIPLVLAIATIALLFTLAKKLNISKKFIFLFILFLIFTPAFIYTFSTISAYAFYTFFVVSGFALLLQRKKIKPLSIIPFIFATLFDLFSTILMVSMLFFYFKIKEKSNRNFKLTLFFLIGISILINSLIFKQPFIIGPFHLQQLLSDLISDFGGRSGTGFFLLLLGFIGTTLTWKRKEFYVSYLILLICIPAYLINTQIIFPLSVVIIFFATFAFIEIFQRKWILNDLKKFTLLILILGILFSSISYLDRISEIGPSNDDIKVLEWINRETLSESIVFSEPENSYYIKYFANREPFYFPHEKNEVRGNNYENPNSNTNADNNDNPNSNTNNKVNNKVNKNNKANVTDSIFNSLYIRELFPILEQNRISIIYITPKMKTKLSSDQGLLFLLKNERFKMVYTHEEYEVWMFE